MCWEQVLTRDGKAESVLGVSDSSTGSFSHITDEMNIAVTHNATANLRQQFKLLYFTAMVTFFYDNEMRE